MKFNIKHDLCKFHVHKKQYGEYITIYQVIWIFNDKKLVILEIKSNDIQLIKKFIGKSLNNFIMNQKFYLINKSRSLISI